MADIVKDATKYRIKQIEIAEAKYYETLIKTLDKIEREVIGTASRLPLTDGKLIELQSAIAIRPQIKAILEREYLAYDCDKFDGPFLYRFMIKPEVKNCASIGFMQI